MAKEFEANGEEGGNNRSTGGRTVLKTSPILYLSKVSVMYTCPMKYWWIHYKKIQPKTKNDKMVWGADFHSLSEVMGNYNHGVAQAELQTKGYSQEKTEELSIALNLLNEKLEEEGLEETLAVEEAMPAPLKGPYFENWFIKSDRIANFKGKLWNTEFKTTSGYGSATAAFYHNSMQTLSYFKRVKECHPAVVGTKLFVLVRTKNPRVEVENILITKAQIQRAEMFMDDAHKVAEHLEAVREFSRIQLRCIEVKSGECLFHPICFATNKEYQNQWIEELYESKNPDEHLGLSGEEA